MYWCHAFKSGDEIDAFLMSFPTDFFFFLRKFRYLLIFTDPVI